MSSENPAPKPTVLIVEDEMILRMRAVDMVEDAGFSPIEAVNADDALALLESRSDIELLFTDIQMPGTMNGLNSRTQSMSGGRRSRLFWCRANSPRPKTTDPPKAGFLASRSKLGK
jgi:CheY-like chemotaxis protein